MFRRSLFVVVTLLGVGWFSQVSLAQTPSTQAWRQAFFTVNQIHVRELDSQEIDRQYPWLSMPMEYANDCSQQTSTTELNPLDGDTGIGWSQIIAVGQKIWKIIQDNKPVVTTKMPVAHALPKGLKCWTDLDHWQPPKSAVFEITYTNLLNIDVVNFKFRMIYTSGGGHNGIGQYLANVAATPVQLDVLWGYTFDANVAIGQAINLGSADNPIAGLELTINWDVSTVLKNSRSSVDFFARGDGSLVQQ